jgi:hypothetical protein
VRLHGVAGVDALSAELRAGRAIALVADAVTLPAGAILCVRRLRDPRPHRVSLAAGQAPPAEWARAVAETLADLARRAARPARGPAGADAEAVIFDDRAQMLACLAADWCRGSIAAWWWWRALIGTSSDAEAIVRAWRQYPAHIAAAVEEAARLGVAAAFVRRLPERATAMLLDAVVAAHGLRRQLTSREPAAPRPPGPAHDEGVHQGSADGRCAVSRQRSGGLAPVGARGLRHAVARRSAAAAGRRAHRASRSGPRSRSDLRD